MPAIRRCGPRKAAALIVRWLPLVIFGGALLAPGRGHTAAASSEARATPGPPAAGAPPQVPAVVPSADNDAPPKLSLPTQTDRDAWLTSGFRLGLGASYGQLVGRDGAPSGRLIGIMLRMGLRLDADWSVMASFQYALGLTGVRFAGTIDPTWHATRHLSLAIGLGFGGLVGASSGHADISPLGSTLDASYTFPSANPPLPSCSGVGAAGLARAEWTVVLGSRAATSLAIEGLGQWTGCVAETGIVEPDTGHAIVRRQWWPHVGATAIWGITWR